MWPNAVLPGGGQDRALLRAPCAMLRQVICGRSAPASSFLRGPENRAPEFFCPHRENPYPQTNPS